ncbi:MAG: type II toxin-antitoxin system ParD family antitoxin, partial [Aliidongia sp.]
MSNLVIFRYHATIPSCLLSMDHLMNVSLTAELEQLIHLKVETGRYNSASEVVREAL